MQRVIARYLDGRIVKGTTHNFQTTGAPFHLLAADGKGEPTKVMVDALKALFFVYSFDGRPEHEERKQFTAADRSPGQKARIVFVDGECLIGTLNEYDPLAPGFFLFPVDPESNNQKVFVVNKSVREVGFGEEATSEKLHDSGSQGLATAQGSVSTV